ncbi:hypothetical protein [Streptomyces sp. I05A-00742]|uniref:hypothetical protein n=1 Tax=Streptomyces sp. I05A-00742 TaxID=2732853 RepID=UPI002017143D|nr:hypothetical protein [Streptomyces sp. I05A-00742]
MGDPAHHAVGSPGGDGEHRARALAAKTGGSLRDGHHAASAADIAMTVLGPETYALLVTGRGWPPERRQR